MYQPPADYVRAKPFKKIYVPWRDHPNYNFIGLIIGPRGNTQKRMEQETGSKISIRGKGSVKEGGKNKGGPDDDDELHVHIDGPTMEVVRDVVCCDAIGIYTYMYICTCRPDQTRYDMI